MPFMTATKQNLLCQVKREVAALFSITHYKLPWCLELKRLWDDREMLALFTQW